MLYLGDIALGSTIDFKFTTRATTDTPTTLIGTPVVSAYVGNSVTEITAGITLTVNFDGRTGCHNVRVVATSGNGYTAGTDIQMVLTAGTVNSVSVVGVVVGSFSIDNRKATLTAAETSIIRSSTATAGTSTTLTLDAASSAVNSYYNGSLILWTSGANFGVMRTITGYVGATKVATFEAALPSAADATPTFTIKAQRHGKLGADGGAMISTDAQAFSNTGTWTGNVVGTVSTLTTYTGNTLQTGDSFARIGAAGVGLTAVGDTRLANLDATVSSRLATAGYTAPPTTAAIATTIWQDLLSGADFGTAGSAGKTLKDNLDAAVSTRSTYSGADSSGTTTLLTRIPGVVQPQTGDSYVRIGAAGASLTAVGLAATQTYNNTGTWTGDVVGTVSTLTTYTGNIPQTGDSFARIGAAGVGLTAVSLTATGLNALTATTPAGVATTFPAKMMQLWARFFNKSTMTATQLKTYADDGTTVVTTQTVSDDATIQTQGPAS